MSMNAMQSQTQYQPWPANNYNTTTQDFRSSRQLPPLLFPPQPSSSSSQPQSQRTHISNSTSPPQKFHLFPLLPPELRLKIWTHTLPFPKLHTVSLPTCACPSPSCLRQHAPRTLSTLPVLLRVSSEARTECLRRYTLLASPSGRGFHLAFDPERDSIYFCNGRGPEGSFWSVQGEWPDCVVVQRGEGEGERIRHLVVDEAVLERGEYTRFAERVVGMESVTILLMPWVSRPGGGGCLLRRLELDDEGENEGKECEAWEEEKCWGLKRLRGEFLDWLEEVRARLELERKPVLKVAQWGACLGDGEEEGQWRLVETGLWVEWEYGGGVRRPSR